MYLTIDLHCKSVIEEAADKPREAISAMPYLGGVVHEGLRLFSPVPATDREANEDVIIPLGTPVRGRNGEMMDHVKISKGTGILIRKSPPYILDKRS